MDELDSHKALDVPARERIAEWADGWMRVRDMQLTAPQPGCAAAADQDIEDARERTWQRLAKVADRVRQIPGHRVNPAFDEGKAGEHLETAIGLGAFAGGPHARWLAPIKKTLARPKGSKLPDPHLSAFLELLGLVAQSRGFTLSAFENDHAVTSEGYEAAANALLCEAGRMRWTDGDEG